MFRTHDPYTTDRLVVVQTRTAEGLRVLYEIFEGHENQTPYNCKASTDTGEITIVLMTSQRQY